MLTITVTGQLTLLMLIEALELSGIKVISANTDGVVALVGNNQREPYEKITSEWKKQTKFDLEYNMYRSYHARDVNNYIAIKTDGSTYGKGVFSKKKLEINPVNEVCISAITQFLRNGTPIEETIYRCQTFKDFITVRTVNGGAVHRGQFLGKAIRWYYSTEEADEFIMYATNGNKVSKSNGGSPRNGVTRYNSIRFRLRKVL